MYAWRGTRLCRVRLLARDRSPRYLSVRRVEQIQPAIWELIREDNTPGVAGNHGRTP
jgi:hypothetical protein